MRTIFSDVAKGKFWEMAMVPVVYENEFYKRFTIGQRGDKWNSFDQINCCKLVLNNKDAEFAKCMVGISDRRTRDEKGIYYLEAYLTVGYKVMSHYLLDNYGI